MVKKYICLLTSFLLCTAFVPVHVLAEGEEENSEDTIAYDGLRIVFTNDLQDHILPTRIAKEDGSVEEVGGYARMKNVIDQYRTDNTVLISGGNFSTGTVFSSIYATSAPDLTLLGMMGYDAVALSSEDFYYGTQVLSDMINVCENAPTLLAGNLEYSSTESADALESSMETKGATYKIIEKGDRKIGIFSVIDQEKTLKSDDVTITDAKEACTNIVKKLESEDVDYVVALADCDELVASELVDVEGIDTIIYSGEETESIIQNKSAESQNAVNLVSCGENGDHIGVLDINEDLEVENYTLVSITSEAGDHEEIQNKINEYKNLVNEKVFDPYGLSFDEVYASNDINFSSVDHDSTELANNNTADLVTNAYAFVYNDWYSDWYDEWKAVKAQRLKAAQSLQDKEYGVNDEEETSSEEVSEETTETGEENAEAEATPTPTPDTELVTEIKNLQPTVKKCAIGLAYKQEITGTFTKDSITGFDASSVVKLGSGTDGSYGESLVLLFVYGSDLRNLAEYDVTCGRKEEYSEKQLYFSGLKYEYNDYRKDYNHVEEVYADAINEYYIPVHDDELYPLVMTYTTALNLRKDVSDASEEKLSVTYYDENGARIEDISAQVLKYKKKEMKAYKAIADYTNDLERNSAGQAEIPASYKSANENKIYHKTFSITQYFKNTTSEQMMTYLEYVTCIITIVVVAKIAQIIYRRKKDKEEEEHE